MIFLFYFYILILDFFYKFFINAWLHKKSKNFLCILHIFVFNIFLHNNENIILKIVLLWFL